MGSILAWFFVFCHLLCLSQGIAASPNFPAHRQMYEYLDQLEAYGCLGNSLRMFRPLNYLEIRELMYLPEGESCNAPDWLIQETKIFSSPSPPPEGNAGVFLTRNDVTKLDGLEAYLTPAFPLREGRPFVDGPNLFFEGRLESGGGGDISVGFSVTPGYTVGLQDYRHFRGLLYLQEGYFKLGYKKLELSIGKMSLGFGEGKHSGLLLSAAGKPLSIIRLSVRPHTLGFLGPMTFETWATAGVESSFVPGSHLLGLGIAFRPSYWLEFGLLEIFQLGGQGVSNLSAGDFSKMLFWGGGSDLDQKRSRHMAFDVNIWLRRHFAKIYYQTAFQSLGRSRNWFSDDMSHLVGLFFPKVGMGNLRLEFVNTHPDAYQHPVFLQGLTYDRLPLGHPLGRDARGVYLDLGLGSIGGWRPTFVLEFENRLKSQTSTSVTPKEDRYGGGLDLAKRWSQTELSLSGRYQSVTHQNHVPNLKADLVAIYANLRYTAF